MEVNYFTILYWFCHTSTWIRHRYTGVSHPEPRSLLPPHTIPLDRPSAPAPSIQYQFLLYVVPLNLIDIPLQDASNNFTEAVITESGRCEVNSEVKVTQSCLTLCDPMDYTVHGFLQARILEWITFPFFRGSSQLGDRTQFSHIAGRFFTIWANRVAF